MNANINMDRRKRSRKILNKRNRKSQGYIHNSCYSYNFINRNNSRQANAISYSEYVLLNPNTKSYIRPNANRTNTNYLKHISSHSMRQEKDQLGVDCYEEYTKKNIQNTSDMIKQHLLCPEYHQLKTTSNETSSFSDTLPFKLRNKSNKIRCGSSEKKEYSSVKTSRKLSKSNEEISRLQLKEMRKNALRDKFKMDITEQEMDETHNVKDISNKIIEHISKMNNVRLVDFLTSDDPRYRDAFNVICKQQSFELTKALRNLSEQEKPSECETECETVNSLIPEFSLKIEELPINVIRELSSTFEEMHKDIEDSSITCENLDFYRHALKKSDGSLKSISQNDNENSNNLNKNYGPNGNDHEQLQNSETNKHVDFINIFDSDEENAQTNQEISISAEVPSSIPMSNTGKKSNFYEIIEQVSSSNQASYNNDIVEPDSFGHPIEFLPNTLVNYENFQSHIGRSATDKNSHGITKEAADSTFPLDSNNLNLKPKIGSVWISKNIFSNTNSMNETKYSDNEHESPVDSAVESKITSNNLSSSVDIIANEISPNIHESSEPTQIQEKQSDAFSDSISEQNISQNTSSKDDSSIEIASISSFTENIETIELVNNEDCISDHSISEEKCTDTENTDIYELNESFNIPNLENNLIKTATAVSPKQPVPKSPKRDEVSALIENSNSENQFILLSINSFERPKDIADAIKYMKVIDEKIDILTKLRQDIFNGLIQNVCKSKEISPETEKGSLDMPQANTDNMEESVDNVEEITTETETRTMNSSKSHIPNGLDENEAKSIEIISEIKKKISITSQANISDDLINKETQSGGIKVISEIRKRKLDTSEELEEGNGLSEINETRISKKTHTEVQQFTSLKNVYLVALFVKIMHDRDEVILGTNNGKIQYHNFYERKPHMTVNIGNSAISFLECVEINEKNYVCTGVTSELEFKILNYKKRFIKHRIQLEDSIQALTADWGYFFIGGKRGYLTRYAWKKDKIQFEDRIFSSGIKDLKTAKEGPRKVLVILFEDPDGKAHIHVKDAMTALHIRTIVNVQNVSCMHLRHSSLYLVRNGEINTYNYCDGNFIKTICTSRSFSSMKSRGNLLLLGTTDGIYGFNMKTNAFLGCLEPKISVASFTIFNKKILCSTWKKKIRIFDIPEHFYGLLENK